MIWLIKYQCKFNPGNWYEEEAPDLQAAIAAADAIHKRRGTQCKVEDPEGREVYRVPGA